MKNKILMIGLASLCLSTLGATVGTLANLLSEDQARCLRFTTHMPRLESAGNLLVQHKSDLQRNFLKTCNSLSADHGDLCCQLLMLMDKIQTNSATNSATTQAEELATVQSFFRPHVRALLKKYMKNLPATFFTDYKAAIDAKSDAVITAIWAKADKQQRTTLYKIISQPHSSAAVNAFVARAHEIFPQAFNTELNQINAALCG